MEDLFIGASVLIWLSVGLITFGLMVAGWWKLFEKAGAPGWMALVPILNTYTVIKIAEQPGWWLFLMLVPILNLFVLVVVMSSLAERYERSALYGLGMMIPVLGAFLAARLGFSDAEYDGELDVVYV